MPLIRSSSSIVAFDTSAFKKANDFVFLNLVQYFDFSVSTKRIAQKSLGSDVVLRNQFVKPDITLNINFYQTIDMLNEVLFGFNKIVSEQTFSSFAKNFLNSTDVDQAFFNKSAFAIFNEKIDEDIIYKVRDTNFNETMITVSFGNLFLNSYSFSYKIKEIPVASCSFLCSDAQISKIQKRQSTFYVKNWNDEQIALSQAAIDNLMESSYYPQENLVFSMKDFVFLNNFSSTTTPGPKIDNFLDGLIQTMDISIEFNRSEFYFFNSSSSVSSRKINSPLRLKMVINGISNNFELETVANFFLQDQKFSCSILMGDVRAADANLSKLLFDNACVENFKYSIDMGGYLNYSIECYCDINEYSGFRILEINRITSDIFLRTLDDYAFITKDFLATTTKL